MRKPGQVTKTRSSKQLLKTLTDNPALPALVRGLQPPVLKRLIDHVGLHDAGALIALTSTAQLREIFEVSLWESLVPGQAERLRPEKFLEWLDVMLEVGAAFTVQRLIELGDTFVVLNFGPLIEVIDASVMAEHQLESCHCVMCMMEQRDESFAVIGDYIVAGLHQDEWESIRTALVELETEDGDFLSRVLARCCNAPTMRDFAPDGQSLLDDETYEREQRRERSGFVTPQIAALFLKTTRQASREELIAARDYDDISQRCFEQLAAADVAAAADLEAAAEGDDDDAPHPDVAPVQLRELEEALVQAAIIGDQQPKLLQGPQNAREPTLELQAHLDRLQITHPAVFAARLRELIFLANVLMAGSWHRGARFTEVEAARAALACANLGLESLLEEQAMRASDRAEFIDAALGQPPGIVRLFRLGWNLLQALPLRCAHALLDALRSESVREQLRHKRWMLDEIESAVNDPDILMLIEQGEFEDVADNLVLLRLVLDPRACQCLQLLIADFPRYPLQLNLGFHARTQASTSDSSYLATQRQIERVDDFVRELPALLKI
jgi:hypothetical protein